jgi:hypothetical protein
LRLEDRVVEELCNFDLPTAVGICHADHVAPSIRRSCALTSPTSDGRSVGIIRMRTKATE